VLFYQELRRKLNPVRSYQEESVPKFSSTGNKSAFTNTMTLTNTIWPSHILAPPEVKQWLSDLYEIVDSKGDDSATKLAALFADNGTMHGMSGQAVGREGISYQSLFCPSPLSY